MDSSFEDSMFSNESGEERFIRSNLSFLIESDDDFIEKIHYISHEEVCIYGTSTIDSRVTESWSVFSTGSLSSPREGPSKFSSLYTPLTLSATPGKSPITEIADPLFFLTGVLQGHTSTPVKRYVRHENVQKAANDPLDLSYVMHGEDRRRQSTSSNPIKSEPLDLSGNALDFSGIMQEAMSVKSFENEPLDLSYFMQGGIRDCQSTLVNLEGPTDLTRNSLDSSYSLQDDKIHSPTFSFKNEKLLDLSYNSLDLTLANNWLKNDNSLLDLSLNSSDFSCIARHPNSSKNVETQTENEGALTPKIEIPYFWKPLPETPCRNLKEPPIQKLNKISKLNDKLTREELSVPPQNESISFDCVKVKDEIGSEIKPQSLTLADFIKKPAEEWKPVVDPTKPDYENKENNFCKFCFKNGELPKIYTGHVTKGPDGIVVCPILRKYVCNFCGATGDNAHTRNYCRLNINRHPRKPFFRRLSNGILTTCHNHK